MKEIDFSYETFKVAYEECEKRAKEKQAERDCTACLNVSCRNWIKNLIKKD